MVVMHLRCLLVAAFLYSALAFCQKPEYDFYTEFRNTWNPKVRAESLSATDQQIAEKYAARLKGEGVADSEITRRMRLVETERPLMEADYYNRVYTQGKANYNPSGTARMCLTHRRTAARSKPKYSTRQLPA